MSRVEQVLAEFNDATVTAKILRALYGAVPGSPALTPMATMEDAVRLVAPAGTAADVARARDIADRTDEIGDILWMGNLMDAGDKGYAVVTGLMAAFKLFKGQGMSNALENDSQQRNDAVLKALGLAYMVYKAFPGSLADKARAFSESTTGRALAVYYGAIEVALPFADNAASLGAGGLEKLFQSQASAQAQRLASMSDGHDIGNAREMLTQVTSQLQSVAGHASSYVQPVTNAIGPYLPSAALVGTATDKAAGALAGAADVLPVYRYLSARLAAEAAARRAVTMPR
ncbi:MAG: hypothetical protein ABMB14_12000 [Myxococcota bacterium]